MTRRVVILSWRPAPAALLLGNTRSRNFMSSTNTASEVDLLLDYLFAVADLVEVHFRLRPALRDPDDDRILDLAALAGAAIVTFNWFCARSNF